MNHFIIWLMKMTQEQLAEAIWACDVPETPVAKLELLDVLIGGLQNQRDILAEEPEKMV